MKPKPYSFRFPSVKPKSHDTSNQAPDFASARDNDQMLLELQRDTFGYFLHETNSENGLVMDKNKRGWPASIAAVGLALTAYPVGVERGFLKRADAVKRILSALRFFGQSEQSKEKTATGYKGFYYHFLDMKTGRRAWQCELSTIDSALLFAGMLTTVAYFDRDTGDERELRDLAHKLYARADWRWAQNGADTVTMGWKPDSGFLPYRWQGYDEALILYILGLGAPDQSLGDASYTAWADSYKWKKIYGHEFLYAGPLFIHQLSHVWIDFRGIQDDYMRKRGIDYFENSRRACRIQQQYAIRNPLGFKSYDDLCWGITASDGPGFTTRKLDGVTRQFYDYIARGAPFGPDDGTLAPWAVVAALPFAPEIVLPSIQFFINHLRLKEAHPYGFKATFNPTFSVSGKEYGWVSPWHYGINQGPIVTMIENYRTEMIWELMRSSTFIRAGLKRAGFTGGWL